MEIVDLEVIITILIDTFKLSIIFQHAWIKLTTGNPMICLLRTTTHISYSGQNSFLLFFGSDRSSMNANLCQWFKFD